MHPMAVGESGGRKGILLIELRHERRVLDDLYNFLRLAFRVFELDHEILAARAHS